MTNRKIIFFFFGATAFFMLLLQIQGRHLITPQSPLGILSLEFSYTVSHAQTIVNHWNPALQGAFKINMLLDFLFIPFYGLFLYSACGYFSVHYLAHWAQRLGVLLAFGSLMAMVFDVTENIAMIFSMFVATSSISTALTATMATLKFTLIGMAVTFIVISALASPFYQRTNRHL